MAFDRLALYNNALLHCNERFLASLAEDREPRRLLDQVWATNGVQFCLEQGQWWFAMRTTMIDYDPSIAPTFGYRKAFTKPIDWIQTSAVCSDEYFNQPLLQYADEVSNWYADITPIYVKYISSDAAYGGDLSRWPASFCDYVAVYFASRIIGKIGGDRSSWIMAIMGPPGHPEAGLLHTTLHKAKNAAAMTQPTQYPAQGSWTRSRRGRRAGWRDRGNTGSLIG